MSKVGLFLRKFCCLVKSIPSHAFCVLCKAAGVSCLVLVDVELVVDVDVAGVVDAGEVATGVAVLAATAAFLVAILLAICHATGAT
jgi:hypothetical protein